MQPLLLTATDFSEVADHAVHYACKMALEMDAEVAVVHSYTLPIIFSDMPIPSPVNDTERIAEETMKNFMDKLRDEYPQLTLTSSVVYGSMVEALEEYVEGYRPPLLVIVGNSYTEENPAWLDSTLMDAFRNLEYPVLAIPANAEYTQVRKIGFAYDNKYEGSDVALITVRDIVKLLGAELHVLYSQPETTVVNGMSGINEKAQSILADAKPLYHVIYKHDIDSAISAFAEKYYIEWLVVLPRKHSFFAGLFHKSHTKMMVNNSPIPILAVHENTSH